jgi:hypothetical protein
VLYPVYTGLNRQASESGHSPACSAEVEDVWDYTHIRPLHLQFRWEQRYRKIRVVLLTVETDFPVGVELPHAVIVSGNGSQSNGAMASNMLLIVLPQTSFSWNVTLLFVRFGIDMVRLSVTSVGAACHVSPVYERCAA